MAMVRSSHSKGDPTVAKSPLASLRTLAHLRLHRNSRLPADPDSLSDAPSLKRDFFHRREFNFTLENDVFVRYLCFRDADELAKAIQIKQPHKIDIGPVYTALVRSLLPSCIHSAQIVPAWRTDDPGAHILSHHAPPFVSSSS